MSDAKLTTTNIGVEQLKSLKKLSTKHGLKQVEFINASIDYFRKTGINPSEEIFSPREEIARLAKRQDEIIGVIKTHEKKLAPLLERLALLDAQIRETTSNLIEKEDLRGIEHKIHGISSSVDRIRSIESAISTGFRDSLQSTNRVAETNRDTALLVSLIFDALKNKKVLGSITDEDIKNFENALRKIR